MRWFWKSCVCNRSDNFYFFTKYIHQRGLRRGAIAAENQHEVGLFFKASPARCADAHGAGNALKHDFGVVAGGAAKLDVANKQYAIAKRLPYVDVAHVGNADRIDFARNNPAVAFDITVLDGDA